MTLPTGTVTFLFSDIQGSTRLLQELGAGYARVLEEHQQILRDAFARNGGVVVDTQGDSFFVAFARALDAVVAAAEAQRGLAEHEWGQGIRVNVRMGVHTGEPTLAGEDYVGIDVHRAARIGSAAYGGQVLISETTQALIKNDMPAGITLRDLGEHRLKDLRTPKRLYQLVSAVLPSEFPPLKTLDATPNNLPVQLTNFIGREKEIREVKELVTQRRLVTLTGSGGSGKTRLSLQVASEMLEAFRDGVWFVELAPLTEAELVPQAIASVLGVREQAGEALSETLTSYLRDKQLLLILDNCEHLIEACARLAELLLRAGPGLHVLASSREGLGVVGEGLYRVPSLAFPDVTTAVPERVTAFEAVRLFVDRAVMLKPAFALTSENAASIARICARLDGIPFALELAAARVTVLSVEQIAEKLGDRFHLLTGGSRTALPRQQTLRAAVDWSYELLSGPERVVLRRLSVFAGGWTLEAAEFVCAGEAIPESDVMDLLTRLVDKSLISALVEGEQARYTLLETIRQYASDNLFEAGEAERVQDRHLEFFVQFCEVADKKIKGAERPEWTRRLEVEVENVRAALEWSLERGDAGLRLVRAMFRFWQLHGDFSEGREWAARVIRRQADRRDPLFADALIVEGQLALWQGAWEFARGRLEESVRVCEQIGYLRGQAEAILWLGVGYFWNEDPASATTALDQSVALFRNTTDRWGLALSIGWQGWTAIGAGEIAFACKCFEECRSLLLEIGDRWSIGLPLHGLARIALGEADYGRAYSYGEQSLALMVEARDTIGSAIITYTLGRIAQARGKYGQAEQWYKESMALEPRSAEVQIGWRQARLAECAQRQGDRTRARELLAKAVPVARKSSDKALLALCLVIRAAIALKEEQLEPAARLLGAGILVQSSPEYPTDRVEYERLMQGIRDRLGESFDAFYEEGRGLTLEQAIALAEQA